MCKIWWDLSSSEPDNEEFHFNGHFSPLTDFAHFFSFIQVHMMNILLFLSSLLIVIWRLSISDAPICFYFHNFYLFFSSSTRRFPGYSREGKKFDADVHRQHIFGLHVANYMTSLKDENPDLYAKQFSRFVKAGIEPTSV
jgi:hypothetical protein